MLFCQFTNSIFNVSDSFLYLILKIGNLDLFVYNFHNISVTFQMKMQMYSNQIVFFLKYYLFFW